MVRTGLSRPAFYAYFRDRYEVVTRLLESIGVLLFALDWRWLSGGEVEEEAREVLVDALRAGFQTFVEYGSVLRLSPMRRATMPGSSRFTGMV